MLTIVAVFGMYATAGSSGLSLLDYANTFFKGLVNDYLRKLDEICLSNGPCQEAIDCVGDLSVDSAFADALIKGLSKNH